MTPDRPIHEVNSPPPSMDRDEQEEEFDQEVLEVGRFIIVKYDDK